MRLIDADALLAKYDDDDVVVDIYDIDNAFTIEAIPIEWLEKWFRNNYNAWTDLMFAWRKENER